MVDLRRLALAMGSHDCVMHLLTKLWLPAGTVTESVTPLRPPRPLQALDAQKRRHADLLAADSKLKAELETYSSQFDELQQKLASSSSAFDTYKADMDKVSRRLVDYCSCMMGNAQTYHFFVIGRFYLM